MSVCILGLLRERPMHPYEMYQLSVQRRQDRTIKLRPGSLYHAVDRLAAQGLIRATGTERSGNRPERTTYEITDQGVVSLGDRVAEMLEAPARVYPEFVVAIAEAHTLDRQRTIDLLERRIATLIAEHHETVSAIGQIRGRQLPEMFWVDLGYQEHMRAAELEWLTSLLGRLASGDMPWIENLPDLSFDESPGNACISANKT
ncbi:PadR family transcriptional regulator [Saxibacter everestensis]|uniref:PadR family transcriptional regulator n=1 Tax=Saxibacter everestensis TaxID=2909229 RepID=A0ABY8QR04_9MICO|nr:PadR family transcriptional regulator [Brevibacteriaceae bacterium ZFBP1038]